MNATNQQLAFARVQGQAAETAHSALTRRAHRQAGVFQLHLALEAYAAELLEPTKLRLSIQPGPKMFTDLLEGFRAAGRVSPELEELAGLEQDPSSWLCHLHQWFANLLNLGGEGRRSSVLAETSLTHPDVPETESIGLINVTETEESRSGPSPALFTEVMESAKALIERQRGSGQEY